MVENNEIPDYFKPDNVSEAETADSIERKGNENQTEEERSELEQIISSEDYPDSLVGRVAELTYFHSKRVGFRTLLQILENDSQPFRYIRETLLEKDQIKSSSFYGLGRYRNKYMNEKDEEDPEIKDKIDQFTLAHGLNKLYAMLSDKIENINSGKNSINKFITSEVTDEDLSNLSDCLNTVLMPSYERLNEIAADENLVEDKAKEIYEKKPLIMLSWLRDYLDVKRNYLRKLRNEYVTEEDVNEEIEEYKGEFGN